MFSVKLFIALLLLIFTKAATFAGEASKTMRPDILKTSVDSSKTAPKHSAVKALWMSAVLPGLGQAYNKKYWKIPIVWAGFAGLGYGLYHTGSRFMAYRNAYRLQVDGRPETLGSVNGISDPAGLKFYRDQNKRNLDITAICTAVWYILNLVDASVDAHLFHYDISDDLSLEWQPVMINNQQPGLGLSLRLR